LVVPPPAPLPPIPHENDDFVMRDGSDEDKVLASFGDAANIPLPDSSILSSQAPEELPERQEQSPDTPRSPGGSVLMGMREDSASPFRTQSLQQQSQHSKTQSQSRTLVSPKSMQYSPTRSVRGLGDSPSDLGRYNGLDHDEPASPSGSRLQVGFGSGSELGSSDKNKTPPLRSRDHINERDIDITFAGEAVVSPRSVDASRRLAAVVRGKDDEACKELHQAGKGNHEQAEKEERLASPDRMITSSSPEPTTNIETSRRESMQVTTPSPLRRDSIQQQTQQPRQGSQQRESGINGDGDFSQQVQSMMSSTNQLQDMMRTPPSPAVASPFRQKRRVVSGGNIIVPQEQTQIQGQGKGLGLSRSPLLEGRSMGPRKSLLRPSPLPLVKDGEKGSSVSMSERRRESSRSMSSSSSTSFRYEETEEDVKTREALKSSAKLKRSLSPSSRDPERAIRMLRSAMRKMSGADGVDFLSFRKMQAIIVYHDDTIFADQNFFDEFLTVVCLALENPLPSASSEEDFERRRKLSKAQDMKKQYLNTVKVLSTVRPVEFSARHVDVIRSLIRASTLFDERDHIISTIEGCVEKIVERCDLSALLNACLNIIEEQMITGENENEQHRYERDEIGNLRAFVSGSGVIARLLAKMNERGQTLDDDMRRRIGKAAGYMACHESVDVRHAVKGVILPLYENVKNDEVFWELLGRHHQGRNLLTYYIKTSQRGI
ncbi:suppressor of tub2 mutation, partial [Ascosphaera aggregata]